ncbi:MAG: hypothetical protein K5896_11120 [Prevotella sp.]|nr:hypothetical protein [Prevotella sp.]
MSVILADNVDIVTDVEPRVSYTVDGKQMDFVGTLVGGFDFYTAAASKTALFLSSGQFWIAGPST